MVGRSVISPEEYGSIGGKGPSDVFALSPVICPSIRKFPRWAFTLIKMVSRPCSIRSLRRFTMFLMISASGIPYMEGDFLSLFIFGRRSGGMRSLTGRSLVSCPFFPWRLSMLGMLLPVLLGLKSYLPLLYRVDSILLCFRLVYKSQHPWHPCRLNHLWRRLPLGRSRCPRGPPLCLVSVYSRVLLFRRKGYLSSSLLLLLPG